MTDCVFTRLATHLSELAMGHVVTDALIEIVKENFSEREAEILLALPTRVAPFRPVGVGVLAEATGISQEELAEVLQGLARRSLLYEAQLESDEKGYALMQFGYGLPQLFFWANEETDHSRKMARLFKKHGGPDTYRKVFGEPESKPWRWVPVEETIETDLQAVVPYASMTEIVQAAKRIALVHCPCRVAPRQAGIPACRYSLEVCVKYDEMADFVINTGIGREISKDEAMDVMRHAEQEGLVHFADNTVPGEVKHTCNCCPCCCWSLKILHERKVPRDDLMGCQFIRATDEEACSGCGECVEACPMDVVEMDGETPAVDADWCIGCGLCAAPCPSEAITMVRREEIREPFGTFDNLMTTRLEERARLRGASGSSFRPDRSRSPR